MEINLAGGTVPRRVQDVELPRWFGGLGSREVVSEGFGVMYAKVV